jgi:hypothetical protein
MSKAADDLAALYEELRDEIERLTKAEATDARTEYQDPTALDQIDRRFLVRSAFAFVDAMAYRLKQMGLEPGNVSKLSAAERALCAEESYELAQNGEIEARPARLRFLPNLRFAFRVAAKAESVDFSLDVSGEGWQAVRNGAPVRDRLMHPKLVDDLVVTDDEVRASLRAFIWVEEQITAWLVCVNERLEQELGALKAGINKPAV